MPLLSPDVISSLQRDQGTQYIYLAATSVLVYDHLITLDDEANLVWPVKWSIGKVLFMLARYPPYIDTIFSLLHQFGVSFPVSLCHNAYRGAGWSNLLGIVLTEVILVMRTWALWDRKPSILIGLLALGALVFASAAYVSNSYLESLEFTPMDLVAPGQRGCYISSGSKIIYADFVVLMVYDTVILILTLIAGVQNYRHDFKQSSVVKSLFRDGIVYFIYLFMFSLLNVIIPIVQPFQSVVALQRVMHSICSVRILLHIRQDAKARRFRSDNPESVNFAFDAAIPEANIPWRSFSASDDPEVGRAPSPLPIGFEPAPEPLEGKAEGHWFGEAAGKGRGFEEDMV